MRMVGKYVLNMKNSVNLFHSHLKVTLEQNIADCSEGVCLGQSVNVATIVFYSHGNDYASLPFVIGHNAEKLLGSHKLSKACF